jgi:hypothetical protein
MLDLWSGYAELNFLALEHGDTSYKSLLESDNEPNLISIVTLRVILRSVKVP